MQCNSVTAMGEVWYVLFILLYSCFDVVLFWSEVCVFVDICYLGLVCVFIYGLFVFFCFVFFLIFLCRLFWLKSNFCVSYSAAIFLVRVDYVMMG